jgi:hypothetical protein
MSTEIATITSAKDKLMKGMKLGLMIHGGTLGCVFLHFLLFWFPQHYSCNDVEIKNPSDGSGTGVNYPCVSVSPEMIGITYIEILSILAFIGAIVMNFKEKKVGKGKITCFCAIGGAVLFLIYVIIYLVGNDGKAIRAIFDFKIQDEELYKPSITYTIASILQWLGLIGSFASAAVPAMHGALKSSSSPEEKVNKI